MTDIRSELRTLWHMPEGSESIIDIMLRPEEQKLLISLKDEVIYKKEDLLQILAGITSEILPEDFLKESYHRGIIDQWEDDTAYTRGGFWSRLDIFATDENERYNTIDEEIRLRLEALYLRRYIDGLGDALYPTMDEIRPVEDILAFIDSKEETPYLATCDCKSLRQACDSSRDLCITYRTGPYSYVRRGLARAVTKEEAKKAVLRAEEEGLIHTVNPGGICSCCTDCCYLFRSARERKSLGIWPKVLYQVTLTGDDCIGCGICNTRCKFDVIENGIILHPDQCQGCGLCVSTCPVNVLTLKPLERD